MTFGFFIFYFKTGHSAGSSSMPLRNCAYLRTLEPPPFFFSVLRLSSLCFYYNLCFVICQYKLSTCYIKIEQNKPYKLLIDI